MRISSWDPTGALIRDVGLGAALVPRFPGVTSALGCVVADLRHDFVRTVNRPLDAVDMAMVWEALAQQVAEGRRLIEAAASGLPIVATSAVDGTGIEELRGHIAARVAEKQAAVQRIEADLASVAAGLAGAGGLAGRAAATHAGRDVPDVVAIGVALAWRWTAPRGCPRGRPRET